MRQLVSMKAPSLPCRPTCANASCGPLWHAATLRLELVPPPRTHRHRYYGVLAPNSPLRAAVTAMAQMPLPAPVPPAQVVQNSPMVVQLGTAAPNEPPPKPKPRPSAHYLWAALIARPTSYLRSVPADLPQLRGVRCASLRSSLSAHYVVNPTTEAAAPPGCSCACEPKLRLIVVTAA